MDGGSGDGMGDLGKRSCVVLAREDLKSDFFCVEFSPVAGSLCLCIGLLC